MCSGIPESYRVRARVSFWLFIAYVVCVLGNKSIISLSAHSRHFIPVPIDDNDIATARIAADERGSFSHIRQIATICTGISSGNGSLDPHASLPVQQHRDRICRFECDQHIALTDTDRARLHAYVDVHRNSPHLALTLAMRANS